MPTCCSRHIQNKAKYRTCSWRCIERYRAGQEGMEKNSVCKWYCLYMSVSYTFLLFFSTHSINWNNPYRSKATDRKHQLALWFNSINLMFRVGNFWTIYFVVINEYLFHSKRVKLNKLFAFLILSARICLLIVHSSAFHLSKNALMMNSNMKTTSKLFAYLFYYFSLHVQLF